MMVDAGMACVGESTVYRVLSDADLLSRWKRSAASSGEYNFRPTAPNQQWHTDVMYVWVAARFYFLLSFVDAYSRYVVHHKLLISLDGQSVAIELQAALEAVSGAKPRVVHDHGSEFPIRDFVCAEQPCLLARCDRFHRLQRCQMPVEILLGIDDSLPNHHHGITLSRLACLDGELTDWQPEDNGHRTIARFRLANPARGDRFLAEALAITGVSLARKR